MNPPEQTSALPRRMFKRLRMEEKKARVARELPVLALKMGVGA